MSPHHVSVAGIVSANFGIEVAHKDGDISSSTLIDDVLESIEEVLLCYSSILL